MCRVKDERAFALGAVGCQGVRPSCGQEGRGQPLGVSEQEHSVMETGMKPYSAEGCISKAQGRVLKFLLLLVPSASWWLT